MPWSCTYVSRDFSKDLCGGLYGISEREKHGADLSTIYKFVLKIPTQRVLVYGILRGYSRKEYEEGERINRKPIQGR